MHEILDALAAQHAELADRLSGLDEAGWQRASRCDGWTVTDVVLHLAQTDEMALASLQGRFGELLDSWARGFETADDVDDGADMLVASQRGGAPADVFERWSAGTAALRAAFAATDPHLRVEWVAGTLSAHTLTATRLAECWIHTGDVGVATGGVPAPTDRLEHVARLAWRTLPYAFDRAVRTLAGPVTFDLVAPSGARWLFEPEGEAATVIEGDGAELCEVAGQRRDAGTTGLQAEGPDAAAVLELVRTFA